MNGGTSYRDREGVEWVDGLGGLYIGRAPDGIVRIAITNGLPPWDPKAETRQGNTLQPEHFARIVERLLGPSVLQLPPGATFTPAPKIVGLTATGAALAISSVLAFFRGAFAGNGGGTGGGSSRPPSSEQLAALATIPPLLTELAWAKDVLARTIGYVGPLAQGPCPLEDLLLVARNQMRG